MKNVFISMLTYNKHEETIACLHSIAKVNTKGFNLHVVILDNGSKEKFTVNKKILGEIPLTVLSVSPNIGFTGGQNHVITYCLKKNADYVIVLNNDTVLDRDLLQHLVNAAEKDPKVGAVVPKIYFAKGHEFHKDWYSKDEEGRVFWYAGGKMDWNNIIGHHRGVDEIDIGQYDVTEETEIATGCCMLMSRQVLEKVGMYDERYFLYYEDADLSMRIKQAGYKLLYEPKGVLWHINAATTGGSGSTLQDYYITRNRMLFGMTYASPRTRFALFRESMRFLVNGRKWQKKGIQDFYRRKFGKGSYA